eukprot:6203828-Pleurochrysis_carterae.AAC.1
MASEHTTTGPSSATRDLSPTKSACTQAGSELRHGSSVRNRVPIRVRNGSSPTKRARLAESARDFSRERGIRVQNDPTAVGASSNGRVVEQSIMAVTRGHREDAWLGTTRGQLKPLTCAGQLHGVDKAPWFP